jgi:Asp-tRNA(Asn)/Glu-tRNA(Gln) amidotransferase A subunit family amidase
MTPHRLTASEAAAAIAAGTLSSEDLVRDCLRRIGERESEVRAWAFVDTAGAIAAARNADTAKLLGAGPFGPLHGVPIGVKDIINTADMPTQHNSVIYRGHRPGSDAAVVMLLRAAGAVVIGKTETIEFAAHGRHPVTRNPHDLSRTPGGSSSGSAAAVGDHMVPLTLGTQTGGSVIRPGSFCGVFGFKPTYGTVSAEGVKLFSLTLDTIGWYGRSVADIALVAGVLEISDEAAPRRTLSELRIGICHTPYWQRAEPEMKAAIGKAAERLRHAGVSIEDAELSTEFDAINDLKETIMRAEGRFAFLNLQRAFPEKISPGITKRMTRIPNHDLLKALDQAAELRVRFDALASRYDAILTPAANGPAPAGLAYAGDPIFNGLWTLLHAPCLTMPARVGAGAMPLGLQLVGARYGDAKLLATAETIAPAIC